MNPIRQWITNILISAKRRAIVSKIKRDLDERLFLFAVEIGRGRRLMPKERKVFAKTFRTAQVLLLLEEELTESPPEIVPIKNILKEPEEEWLLKEPVIRAELEHRLKQSLNDLDDPANPDVSSPYRAEIVGSLEIFASAYPDLLSPKEIGAILDRLDHPLDRA